MGYTLATQQTDLMSAWQAQLKLSFALRDNKTRLTRREHNGPLVVQKTLYPEGASPAHMIVLHPPGGVAGGDQLLLQADLSAGSSALLTTPGATKWYKANNRKASQHIEFKLDSDGILEWFPQENIIFNGADVQLETNISLYGNAVFSGWDICCLGRQAGAEAWSSGAFRQLTALKRDERLIWHDTAVFKPDSPVLKGVAGLNSQLVFGNFIVAAGELPETVLDACRNVVVTSQARIGVTAMSEVFSARYIGLYSQEARNYFEQLWQCLRPWYAQRKAQRPRIWFT